MQNRPPIFSLGDLQRSKMKKAEPNDNKLDLEKLQLGEHPTVKQVYQKVNKMNESMIDLARYILSKEDSYRYNPDSKYVHGDGKYIYIRSLAEVVNWVQGITNKHTSSAEEMIELRQGIDHFTQAYQALDQEIQSLKKKCQAIKEMDQMATDEDIQSFERVKSRFADCQNARDALVASMTRIRNETAKRPEELAVAPDQTGRASDEPMVRLFDYFKADLRAQYDKQLLSDTMLQAKPNDLLVAFVLKVQQRPNDYPKDIQTHVADVVWALGGTQMIQEAFNTDSAKKHGVLKTPVAKEFLNNVSSELKSMREALKQGHEMPSQEFKENLRNLSEVVVKESEKSPRKPR